MQKVEQQNRWSYRGLLQAHPMLSVVVVVPAIQKHQQRGIEKFSRMLLHRILADKNTVYKSAIGLSLRGLVAKGRKFPQDLRADALPLRTQKAKISSFSDSEQRFLKKVVKLLIYPTVHRLLSYLLYWGILPLCCGLIVASSEENPSLPVVLLPGVWADVPREIPSSPLVKSFKSSEAVAPRGLSSPWKHKWHFSKFNFKKAFTKIYLENRRSWH